MFQSYFLGVSKVLSFSLVFLFCILMSFTLVGPEATVAELIDFISAAQVAKSESLYWQEDNIKVCSSQSNVEVKTLVLIYVYYCFKWYAHLFSRFLLIFSTMDVFPIVTAKVEESI